MYGNPETTTGGRALKFYASVRIDVRKADQIKNGGEILGNRVKCKVVKNKVAPPFRTAEFDILYGEGISRTGELIDMGIALDVIKKSGAWLYYNGDKLGQGRDKARALLDENRELFDEIEAKIRAMSDNLELVEADEFELDEDDDDGFDIRTLELPESDD